MATPQQPELARSGRSAADPASAKTKVQGARRQGPRDPANPVPEDNAPGHHPVEEQDKPVERFRQRATALARDAERDAASRTREAALHRVDFDASAMRFPALVAGPVDGEPVLLLHGFPQPAHCWVPAMEGLAEHGFRTIAPRQRGYAATARPAGSSRYRLDLLVGDALGVADAAGADRFHLVGHDWGGVVGWALAAGHPERLLSFTSVSMPHPSAFVASLTRSLQLLQSGYIGFFKLRGVAETTLAARGGWLLRQALRLSGLPGDTADDYVRDLLEQGALTPALEWYRAARPGSGRVGRVEVPTLFVWGPADTALGPVAAKSTGRYVDGPYHFEILDGAGHWIPETHAEPLAELIAEHIRRAKGWAGTAA